ncbi:MAG: hypothetical protein KC503_17365 [Myxococcales bacterium]|nr:hypothetical protein [Myxococcales bacterium]
MRFGGETQFGRGRYGGVGTGKPIGYIIRRMIAAMEQFRYDPDTGTGSLRTLERLTGSIRDKATWDIIASRGFPAVLVAYAGGPFVKPKTMDGAQVTQAKRIHVVCIADSLQGKRIDRLEGKRRNLYEPGLDNITSWVVRYMGRELLNLNLAGFQPVDEDVFAFDTNAFASIIEWRVEATIDLYDDPESDNEFTRLGITHTPKDFNNLFESDNITPKTDSPTSPATGYADLDDDTSTAPVYEE